MSIEELMDINVVSVGKKSHPLSSSATAITVITAEEIRNSGVTTIAEALKLVPGLHVGRLSSDKWGISSRDLNSRFAETLLVLMDGRTLYTPTFSGVYWEVQDTFLPDIERIEVIRGPGATLWGANAVNGVINIITKNSKDTHGGMVEIGMGTLEHGFAGTRYGTVLNDMLHARLYAKGNKRDPLPTVGDRDDGRGWNMFRGGFRIDGDITRQDTVTLQGDIYRGDIYQYLENLTIDLDDPSHYNLSIEDHCEVNGGNVLLSWKKLLSSSSEWQFKTYFDHTYRKEIFVTEKRETVDLEFEHRFSPLSAHDVVWGVQYNASKDEFDDTFLVQTLVESRNMALFSLFIQDEIEIMPDRLWFTLGSKLERNEYTGNEFLPSARLFWSAHTHHKFWCAVSKAVRNPSRLDRDTILVPQVTLVDTGGLFGTTGTDSVPLVLMIKGGDGFDSETLVSWEIGYRCLISPRFSVDVTGFYHRHKNSRRYAMGELLFHGTWIEQEAYLQNGSPGSSYGAEISLAWQPLELLKVNLGYTYLQRDLYSSDNEITAKAPEHQISLRSTFTPSDTLTLSCRLEYVDACSQVQMAYPTWKYDIDDYTTVDATLIWKVAPRTELTVSVKNLMGDEHVEAVQELWAPSEEVDRSIYGKITYYF